MSVHITVLAGTNAFSIELAEVPQKNDRITFPAEKPDWVFCREYDIIAGKKFAVMKREWSPRPSILLEEV